MHSATRKSRLLTELASDLAFGIRTLRTRAERAKGEVALRDKEEHIRSFWTPPPRRSAASVPKATAPGSIRPASQMLGYADASGLLGKNLHAWPTTPAGRNARCRRRMPSLPGARRGRIRACGRRGDVAGGRDLVSRGILVPSDAPQRDGWARWSRFSTSRNANRPSRKSALSTPNWSNAWSPDGPASGCEQGTGTSPRARNRDRLPHPADPAARSAAPGCSRACVWPR